MIPDARGRSLTRQSTSGIWFHAQTDSLVVWWCALAFFVMAWWLVGGVLWMGVMLGFVSGWSVVVERSCSREKSDIAVCPEQLYP